MNSYHKAMLNTMRGDPVYLVSIPCSGELSLGPSWEGCHGPLDQENFLLTKPEAIRIALEDGWTYDSEGKWMCPSCKKRKEEECHHGHVGECVLCADEREEAARKEPEIFPGNAEYPDCPHGQPSCWRCVRCEEEEAINKGE